MTTYDDGSAAPDSNPSVGSVNRRGVAASVAGAARNTASALTISSREAGVSALGGAARKLAGGLGAAAVGTGAATGGAGGAAMFGRGGVTCAGALWAATASRVRSAPRRAPRIIGMRSSNASASKAGTNQTRCFGTGSNMGAVAASRCAAAATGVAAGVSNADTIDLGKRFIQSRRCELSNERSPPALRLPALPATALSATEATPPSNRCADSRPIPLDCATAS